MHIRSLMTVLGLAVGLVLFGTASTAWAADSDGDGVDNAIDVCNNTPPGTAVDPEGRPLGDIDLDCDTDLDDYALIYEQGYTDLEDYALFQQGFTGPLPHVVIDTVPVGNPGNFAVPRGRVDYVYNIAKFEVTAGQYTEFLNAVAAMDTYELYNGSMWSNAYGCKIEQTGLPGSYAYSVAANWVNRPVNYVSWGDAARFVNWLHNGQPTGAQGMGSTENGSYYLNGAMTNAELMAITRGSDATWVIPSEDEWYKAAYHKNDGVTGNYYDYPTGSHSVPSSVLDLSGNNATFSPGPNDTIGPPYYRTEVGAHENSESPYGTFDQGGNLWEWNEAVVGSSRGLRGGAFNSGDLFLHRSYRSAYNPAFSNSIILGFRVAEIP